MKRKPVKQLSRMNVPKERKPTTPDPTEDEIWGVGGLAEQERMKRPQSRWPEFPEHEEVRE